MFAALSVAMLLGNPQPTSMTVPAPQAAPAIPRPAPARESAADKKGTAIIKGHVRTSDGRQLRRAQVLVRGAALSSPRDASTGLEGEYEIGELPAGRYTITVTRSGFLPVQYGQRRSGEQGKPLEVAEGATLDAVDFSLERAAVISGRVTDEAGEPVGNAAIYSMRSQYYRGRRQLVPILGGGIHATTDDSGMYRLPSVAPGEYVILASFRETWTSDDKDRHTLGYAPSYYPGTSRAADAQRVKVAAAQEATGIDFSLVPGRTAVVSGTVTTSDGAPFGGAGISLLTEIMGPEGGSTGFAGNTRASADGRFTLRDVPPGEYTVRATGPVGDRGNQSASAPLTVAGADVEIALAADGGGLLAGRVITDTGDPLPSPAARVTAPSPVFDQRSTPLPPGEDGLVGDGGRFTRRTISGPALVRIGGLPSGWALKRVTLGDRDVTDAPVEIRAGQTLADVTVVVSQRLPSLSGTVTDAAGRPADAPVVLFPADSARWLEASGALRSTRPDQSGRYRFDAVRPGEYLLIAVAQMEPWQVNDPEFLAPLRARAAKVSISETAATFDLKVAR
jgi:protocatechuate 3,4-dioxygenase beta subunit